ncbi:MAG: hypothetical protein HS115_05450 [Spirochaetales bacterium]|nr:hypothetical protein [Spirochaetales bacterium]
MILSLEGLASEEILLVNGTTISGRILSQDPGSVKVSSASGVQTLAKSQISRIQYVKFTEAQKQTQRAAYIQAVAAYRERIQRLRQAQMEAAEQRRKIQEAEAAIQEEKQKEAREVADRAAALRDLKEEGKFENRIGEPISYWDFAWHSLLLPGWGHFYIGKPVVGSLYALSVAGLAGNTYERRRVALRAVNENHHQVERNFLLSLQPDLADLNTRIFLSYYANAKAFTHYQGKVNDYHNSLYALQSFYLFQVAHIIYNGIAWENGLLIVDKDTEPARWQPEWQMALVPDQNPTTGRFEGQKLNLALGFRF